MSKNSEENLRFEYEELRQLRVLWSKALVQREQIVITAMFVLIGASMSQLPNFNDKNLLMTFLISETIVVGLLGFYWRWLSYNTDKEIVNLYGRMLEIEQLLNMDTQTKYYFNNLKRDLKIKLFQDLDVSSLTDLKYERFKSCASRRDKKHHARLLEIWKMHDRNSVGPRGHDKHDILAVLALLIPLVLFLLVLVNLIQIPPS